MINDGFNEIKYEFGEDSELNRRVSKILNEAVHVFRHHPDGNWKAVYKPKYSEALAEELSKKPSIIRKLLKLKDPVVSNITYSAIAVVKSKKYGST